VRNGAFQDSLLNRLDDEDTWPLIVDHELQWQIKFILLKYSSVLNRLVSHRGLNPSEIHANTAARQRPLVGCEKPRPQQKTAEVYQASVCTAATPYDTIGS
jgi:hypothetical protein